MSRFSQRNRLSFFGSHSFTLELRPLRLQRSDALIVGFTGGRMTAKAFIGQAYVWGRERGVHIEWMETHRGGLPDSSGGSQGHQMGGDRSLVTRSSACDIRIGPFLLSGNVTQLIRNLDSWMENDLDSSHIAGRLHWGGLLLETDTS